MYSIHCLIDHYSYLGSELWGTDDLDEDWDFKGTPDSPVIPMPSGKHEKQSVIPQSVCLSTTAL